MRIRPLLALAALAVAALSAPAATIYQTFSQSAGSVAGWNTNIWGTPATNPIAGNDYVTTNGFFVRTPNVTAPAAFAGDSLQIDGGGTLWLKHSGGAGALVNLKMNGGIIQFHGGTGAGASPLSGTIQVLTNTTLSSDQTGVNARDIWLQSTITGSSNLNVNMSPAGSGLIVSGNNSAYAGNWNCTGGFILITNGTTAPLGSGSVGLVNVANSLIFNTTNSLVVSNVISGLGSLSKLNTNTLTLDGNNPSFGGTVSVGNGVLKVQSATAISNALTISLVGGTLDASPMGGLVLNAAVPQTLNCRGTIISNLTASSGNVMNFNLSSSTNDVLNVTGSLTLNGNPTLNLTLAGYKPTGTYRLINYSGTIQGGGAFTLNPPGGSASYGLDTSTPGQVNLTVTNVSNNQTWTGAASTTWDTVAANWTGGASVYADGDTVTFNDTSAVNMIDITSTVYPKSMTVSNATQAYTFIFSGISTDGLLTKLGTNELVFANTNNNFNGPIDIRAGVLSIGAGGGFGFLGNNVGPITNNGLLRVNLTGGGQAFSNTISGSGGFELTGGGAIVAMRAANTYTGPTTIGDGCQLNVATNSALGSTSVGTVVLPNGRLGVASLVGTLSIPEPIVVSGTGIAAAPGALYANTTGNNITWAGPVTIVGDSRFRAVNPAVAMNFSAPVLGTNVALWCTVGGAPADSGATMTFLNTLSLGSGALTKDGQGTLVLAGGTNVCSSVTVSNGAFLVNGILTGGDTTIFTDGTLGGSGTNQGSVTVQLGGTIAPGSSIGKLTVNNAVTNSGTMLMEINRTNTPNADLLVAASIFVDGTLTVANTGPALQAGDTFNLFDGTMTGTFSLTNLPALSSTNLYWDVSLLQSQGVISVGSTSLPPPPQPTIQTPTLNGTNLTLQVVSQSGYTYVLEATPVLAPATWTGIQTNSGGGTLIFTVPVSPAAPKQFFRINAY